MCPEFCDSLYWVNAPCQINTERRPA